MNISLFSQLSKKAFTSFIIGFFLFAGVGFSFAWSTGLYSSGDRVDEGDKLTISMWNKMVDTLTELTSAMAVQDGDILVSGKISGVDDPIDSGDAANKNYVDTEIQKIPTGISEEIINNKISVAVSGIESGTTEERVNEIISGNNFVDSSEIDGKITTAVSTIETGLSEESVNAKISTAVSGVSFTDTNTQLSAENILDFGFIKKLIKTESGENAEIGLQSGENSKWALYHDETTQELRFWNVDNIFTLFTDGSAKFSGKISATQYCDENGENCKSLENLTEASLPACTENQILKHNGTDWECAENSGGTGEGSSMVEEWSDIIKCTNTSGDMRTLTLGNGPYRDGRYYYYTNDNTDEWVGFNADKSYYLTNGFAGGSCDSKTMTQLKAEKKAFNLAGGASSFQIPESTNSCAEANEGEIKYNKTEKAFEGCNGEEWVLFGELKSPIYASCKAILDAGKSTGSKVYTINPDGENSGEDGFEAYCDMDTDGGGWTLAKSGTNNTSVADWSDTSGYLKTISSDLLNNNYALSDHAINTLVSTSYRIDGTCNDWENKTTAYASHLCSYGSIAGVDNSNNCRQFYSNAELSTLAGSLENYGNHTAYYGIRDVHSGFIGSYFSTQSSAGYYMGVAGPSGYCSQATTGSAMQIWVR